MSAEINLKTNSNILKDINSNNAEIKIGTPQINVSNNYETLKNKPSINGVELVGNKTTEDLRLIYSMLLGLPTINGKKIIGDLTTDDLGIEVGSDIDTSDFITKNNAQTEFDIELEYDEWDYYTANAIHQLLELFVYEITMIQEGFGELYDAVSELVEKEPLIVTGTFSLSTQKLTNISHYYDKIKLAYDNGQDIKLKVTVAESGNIAMADISVLDVSKKSAFFYPIMRTNIGFGNEIYFFDVEIKQSSGSLTSHVLQTESLGE